MQIDWAVVAATFLGPILAVIVTLFHQRRHALKQVQMGIFCDMMQWRRDTLNPQFVSALNLIPIHFRKKKAVITAYSRLMDTLSDPSWNVTDAIPSIHQKSHSDVANLLHELSKAVGAEVDYAVIAQGGYAPTGWINETLAQRDLRDRLALVLSGEAPLEVVLRPMPTDEAQKALTKQG
ncbi:DUF6680 family protein [Paracoccus homiensis]|uniref:DUF6680 domain-containing protein n=1 Tax=Paracoccus homiensis TaxID=364199 RepID=A0A1I0BPI0_9RHOB|nr:DUF6680 family protein [Paracoccus homiensis]SET08583.1 hypothetical protein SAMN04489858_1039 [Paracoccus homiensis]